MQKFKINRQPYLNKFIKSMENVYIHFEGTMLTGFSNENVVNLVRASGLKTKNTRKIKKRFKKLIEQMLIEGIKKYEHGREKK